MNLKEVSSIVWNECIGIKKNEITLVITDSKRLEIGNILWQTGEKLCKCSLILLKKMPIHGAEPAKQVAKAMLENDVIVAATTFSLTHTKAVRKALKVARVATLPGITKDTFLRAIPVDYNKMKDFGEKLIKNLKGKAIEIKTKAGTNIYLDIKGRKFLNFSGLCLKRGDLVNLPDGEVLIAPLEGKAEGKIVIDLSSAPDSETKFGKIGLVKKPFTIKVEKGQVIDCTNPVLWEWLSSVKNGTNLAELGIGTNPKARIIGSILEDEKVLGTAHFAFGTNKSFGGKIQTSIHLDSVFNKPTTWVDEKLVIKDGEFLF